MKLNAKETAAGIVALLVLAIGLANTTANAAAFAPVKPALASTAPDLPHGGPNWSVVSSPNVGAGHNQLWGVDALSSSDVWAVGYYDAGTGTVERTLIERWDGGGWSVIPSPNVGANDNRLTAVAAVSSSEAWAVGNYDNGSVERTLILRWNGSEWSVVPSPNVGSSANYLTGVAAVSANDVWAVGYYFPGGTAFNTLTLHWDGNTWSVVPSPSAGNTYVTGVAAVSSSDVWAVGYHVNGIVYETFTLHWDGSVWSIVPSPNIGTDCCFLLAVSAVSSSDVWAVGYFIEGFTWNTFTLHWNGNAWSIVPSPDVGATFNFLYGVSAVSSSDVWAVGYYHVSNVSYTLIEHWDGNAWSVVSSPNPGTLGNQLNAVAATSANDVWAAGHHVSTTAYQTLVERYSSTSSSPTPSSTTTPIPSATPTGIFTNTPTPPAPTHTPQPPSSTPIATATPTPTLCPITFTDVHQSDYFYDAVRYLYCSGVISGYSDNTFRPYNNTTRGQLTKIVILGFGFPLYSPPAPTFTDVPVTHTFYQYIETAAHEGLVSGYADATFRPQNDVTRGQLSKIVVIAAGWPLANPPTATFSDVAPGSPFYQHIETAYDHGIISGYADGTFRPGNNATRGQICKIVYNALQ